MASVSWRRVQKGIAGLPGRILHGYPIAFHRDKQRLIDHAFGTLPIEPRSCAGAPRAGTKSSRCTPR